jgi:RNA polymerase sigma factor (sigma-70 family)
MTRFRADLVKFAASMVGWQDAEDMVQNVAVRLLESDPEFASLRSERAWLFQVTYRCCIDHLRETGTHSLVALHDLTVAPVTSDPTGDRERLWDASRLLSELTAEECDWLAAYAYYGSLQVASDALGLAKETFRDRLARVREKLTQEVV